MFLVDFVVGHEQRSIRVFAGFKTGSWDPRRRFCRRTASLSGSIQPGLGRKTIVQRRFAS